MSEKNEFYINFSCVGIHHCSPKGVVCEYRGFGQNIFFVVFRPEGEAGECGEPSPIWDEKDVTVFMGSLKKEGDIALLPGKHRQIPMDQQVKVFEVKRSDEKVVVKDCKGNPWERVDNSTLWIKTDKGHFYLPSAYYRPNETPTFNDQPIKYF